MHHPARRSAVSRFIELPKSTSRTLARFAVPMLVLLVAVTLAGCPAGPAPAWWPISKDVLTTAEQQIHPVSLAADTTPVNPSQVSLYATYGYSDWTAGAGTDYGNDPGHPQAHDKRTDLAPDYAGAPGAARLLRFFSFSDVHISDKESPAQPLYVGWSAPYGASTSLAAAYSPVLLSTTQVLDAAVQTVNALDRKTPFDFGIMLGDAVNNTQYNELRWYIDVIDGKVITPSSGAHAGAWQSDYQRPFKAAGLNKRIPWYQVLGNHDQFWMGSSLENIKTLQAHIGNTVLNMENNPDPSAGGVNGTGTYMGVIDGTTPYGDVIKGGPQGNFEVPPRVVADPDRRSLATLTSSSNNWMREFFDTESKPVGHGFTQDNLDNDSACYSFVPESDIPLKVIVLDNTVKGSGQANYAAGGLDEARLAWLKAELQAGQDNDQLMIIAAHIPILPGTSLTDPTPTPMSGQNESELLASLHEYPNLILWIAGHRHVNVVSAQPYDQTEEGQGPENSFWEVETPSLKDFPQQFRTFDIRRNTDNTISIFVTDVDPAVRPGTPAAKSRGYAIGTARVFAGTPEVLADSSSQVYNAELIKQLTPAMQAKIAMCGTAL